MKLMPLAGIAVSLALLAVAVPYSMAAYATLPDQRLVAALEEGRERDGYGAALERHSRALSLFADSQIRADMALVSTSAARQGDLSWGEARLALITSLQARPLDPVNWARLAYVLGAPGAKPGPDELAQARAALLQSMVQGRFMPGFMQWRLILALTLWDGFSRSEQQVVTEQVGLLWQKKRSNLIRLARIPALAPRLESIMRESYTSDIETFLRQRRPLRHNRGQETQP